MTEFHWKQQNDSAILFSDKGIYQYKDVVKFTDEALKWCAENKIHFWYDDWKTIKFVEEQDLILFLLRWG